MRVVSLQHKDPAFLVWQVSWEAALSDFVQAVSDHENVAVMRKNELFLYWIELHVYPIRSY
jgi:hypothetical protein